MYQAGAEKIDAEHARSRQNPSLAPHPGSRSILAMRLEAGTFFIHSRDAPGRCINQSILRKSKDALKMLQSGRMCFSCSV